MGTNGRTGVGIIVTAATSSEVSAARDFHPQSNPHSYPQQYPLVYPPPIMAFCRRRIGCLRTSRGKAAHRIKTDFEPRGASLADETQGSVLGLDHRTRGQSLARQRQHRFYWTPRSPTASLVPSRRCHPNNPGVWVRGSDSGTPISLARKLPSSAGVTGAHLDSLPQNER